MLSVHTWDESVGDESSSILFPPAGLTGESVSEEAAPLVSWLWLWLGSAEVSLSNVPAENFFFCSRKFRRELRAPPPPPPPPPSPDYTGAYQNMSSEKLADKHFTNLVL